MYPDREIPIDFRRTSSGETVNLGGGASLRFEGADHTVPALSCRVQCDCGFSLTFTGDTRPSRKVASLAGASEVLIGEAFGLQADFGAIAQQQGHMTAEDLVALIDQARPKITIPFHLHIPYMSRSEETRRMRDVLDASKSHIAWLTPGSVLDLER